MTSTKNLYALLGLAWGASDEQVKSAYRQLAKSLHPDLHPDDAAGADRFKDIVAAYWVLSDPARKAAYLRDQAANHVNFEHYYREARRWADQNPPPDEPEDGQDIVMRLPLTLEEIAAGIVKKVKIRRQSNCRNCLGTGWKKAEGDACPACHGTGKVPDLLKLRRGVRGAAMICLKCEGTGRPEPAVCHACHGRGRSIVEDMISVGIPAGVEEHYKIVISGQGHDGIAGGETGDLRIIVQQKEHPYLERRGCDLVYLCPITFSQWLQGAELRIPSLNGKIQMRLEPCLKPEGTLRLANRGFPKSDGSHGDLLIQYSLCVPKKISAKQLIMLQRLEETAGFSPPLDDQGLIRKSD